MNIEFTFEGLLLAGVTGLIITFAVDLWGFLKRMRNADLKKVPDPRARKSGMVKTHSQNVRKGTQNRRGEDFYHSGLHPYHQDPYSALEFDTRDSAVCGGRGSTEGSYGGSNDSCGSSSSNTGSNSGDD